MMRKKEKRERTKISLMQISYPPDKKKPLLKLRVGVELTSLNHLAELESSKDLGKSHEEPDSGEGRQRKLSQGHKTASNDISKVSKAVILKIKDLVTAQSDRIMTVLGREASRNRKIKETFGRKRCDD